MVADRISVAALTFLVWQAFLTFDKEVQYIWPCVPIDRRSFSRMLMITVCAIKIPSSGRIFIFAMP